MDLGPLGVFILELIRTLTFGRIMTWLVMALFPPTLIGIASWQIGGRSGIGSAEMNFGYVVMLFFLIPQIVTVLRLLLLLWATPIVHAELEARYRLPSIHSQSVFDCGRFCCKCSISSQACSQHGEALRYDRKRSLPPVLLGFVRGRFDVHLPLTRRGKSVRLAVGSLSLFLRQVFHRATTIAFGFLRNPSLSLPSGFCRIFIIKN